MKDPNDRQRSKHILGMLGASALCASAAVSAAPDDAGNPEKPYRQPDASWISLSGEVTETFPDGFRMDYGDGIITVEMDDWDLNQEGKALLAGDDVTVYGRVDADLYQRHTLEADSVFVDALDTFFYANDADEEALTNITAYTFTVPDDDESYVTITGQVAGVQGRELTVDTGENRLSVDTSTMTYNPVDDTGYQKVEKGDQVSVAGMLEESFFEDLEIEATSVVTLQEGGEGSRDTG